MSDVAFEMAQTLRKSHCDRKTEGHECVGTMTICRGKIELDCVMCGPGSDIPGWDHTTAVRLERIFGAVGISWDSLSITSQLAAIEAYPVALRGANICTTH